MPSFDVPDLPAHFCRLLEQCRELYLSSARRIVDEHPRMLSESAEQFIERMDDLHRGLLVKIFVAICEADRRWSRQEQTLAEVLVLHLWNQRLEGDVLRVAWEEMSQKAMELKWYAVIRPFDQIAPLRNRVGELETLVVRIAHLIARADGPMKPVEAARIKSIQNELNLHLREIPIDEPEQRELAQAARTETIQKIQRDTNKFSRDKLPARNSRSTSVPADIVRAQPSPESLEMALAELDRLIGLEGVKREVRTLTNFLKVQQQREQAGLPTTGLSLHMIFGGNPGTGKTTVARIVGKIYGSMGVLKKGHLIETDRSGLVAEYAGQTGPKTNKKIDEALDGVLFIDEAYTLISSEGDDPYGHEAVQALLKRMEDERDRLVVILAGYPREMQALLRSNPGLSSRFSRKLEFCDYQPIELARIFGLMCGKNHYELRCAARGKVMFGFQWLYEHRDQHFGNGRASRNRFEHAIRRMANRIADMSDLSIEQLTTLEVEDIEFERPPADLFAPWTKKPPDTDTLRFHIECGECQYAKDVPLRFLGQTVKCPRCQHQFLADWGEVFVP
jgi:SpoVK/Ycf46/Vps4 family AAA+-type ATPase